jgi:hypothetical protein
MYHSIALLLPDGRVITAGSNPEANNVAGGELRLELYHPPYLFKSVRPIIQHAPQQVHYGDSIAIETPQAHEIKWISLIRPMATTHSWDSNQRLIDVPFHTEDSCHVHGVIPREAAVAPPGWYMLFLTDRQGIPSVARWVHLDVKPKPLPIPKLGPIHVRGMTLDHGPATTPSPVPKRPRRATRGRGR